MTTTAKIAAKGCTSTGITEDLAQLLHDNLGKHLVCVVELVAESRSENRNGDEKVHLNILTVEPAAPGLVEDYLRNMQSALYYERKLKEDGPQLRTPGDDPVPNVKDVIAQGAGVLGEEDGEPRLLTDPDVEDPESDPAEDPELDLDEPAADEPNGADHEEVDDRPDDGRVIAFSSSSR